jgi:hypothetical protein
MIRSRDEAVQAGTGLGLKPHAGMIGVIVLLAGLAAIPLRLPGIANSDDILPTIYRVFSLHASWQAGVFYPRLSSELAYAYGVPLFQFYPPLASYVAELFHVLGLGFINAIKVTYLLGLVCAGLGMYVYVARLFGSRAGALLAAVAYMYAPYYFVDIFKRGALAEALALALLPWILWAFSNLHQTGGRGWFVLTALALAALVLTHNSLSLFFLPLLIMYLAVLGLGRRWWLCLAAVGLALGLSTFFWLPAIAERTYVNFSRMTQGMYDVSHNLLPLRGLLQRGFLFDYSVPHAFRWGLVPAILTSAGFVVGLWKLKSQRRLILFFALVVAVALLLQAPAAAIFWTRLPLVNFIQFPWRLQTFVALGGAILIGALPALFARPSQTAADRPDSRAGWLLTGVLAVVLISTSTARLWPAYQAAWHASKFSEGDISRQYLYARGRSDFELFGDYQPIGVAAAMTEVMNGISTPTEPTPQPWPTPAVQVLRWRPAQFVARVTAQVTFPLALHRFYFPGWQARIDGQAAPVYPSGELGLVTVDVPAGDHAVELRFGDTPLRRLANGLSLLSLGIWLVLAIPTLRRRPWLMGLLLLVLLAAVAAWGMARPSADPAQRQAVQANLGGQAQLTGYALDRSAYRPGEEVRVTLYWEGLRRPDKDYKVFVHLRDLADQQMISQHDSDPVYGYTPTTRWEPGELLADEHLLPLPADTPPGTYQLWVGMYDPATGERLTRADAPGQDRLPIGTVIVQ